MATDFPIITKLGGRERVRELLAEAGRPRNHGTIKQWIWRRNIPGHVQRELMRIAAEHQVEVTYADFVITSSDDAAA